MRTDESNVSLLLFGFNKTFLFSRFSIWRKHGMIPVECSGFLSVCVCVCDCCSILIVSCHCSAPLSSEKLQAKIAFSKLRGRLIILVLSIYTNVS